jgi:hypothetical protein
VSKVIDALAEFNQEKTAAARKESVLEKKMQ